jgi:acetylglutamate kinase
MSEVIVVKIGGSTLGSHDTALADIVELQRRGPRLVVVHGGGPLINDWLARHRVPTRFENGLRVTDEASLEVVVSVLAGAVNKQIVGTLSALGGPAIGLSGADAGIMRARVLDEKLGFVGEITGVDSSQLLSLVDGGLVPVIAPIALEWKGEAPTAQLLNLNADTAAGAIAAALGASRLVFLTDVAGVRAGNGAVASRLPSTDAEALIQSGVIEGGMIPKVQACIAASKAGCEAIIVDGREERSLLHAVEGQMTGTTIA